MHRRAVATGLIVAACLVSAPAAAATETRDFRGEGSSDFGLQLYYARDDARRQATAAGFGNCTEIYQKLWPYTATVIWRCTRISV
ncbi:hypothetical protein [Amycolatopsis sp. CA-230715]|uniref:hypothetical protein n=1 Tax=Amycolatopsis sp. CA-230715 TaxID=2745196 RepID=UPI001C32DFB8|nr:hypothetical protein [Amycolatopsis sp. CA-230715]QWF84283.1 hypothetical protein HUW46_07733 [Amycolatopsis sp. CA-230715]